MRDVLVTKMLLIKKADLEAKNWEGKSPLNLAADCVDNDISCAEMLLKTGAIWPAPFSFGKAL